MPEVSDRLAKPQRTWRPVLLWSLAIIVALGCVWFVVEMVILPPKLRERNEIAAVSALKQYAEAQVVYRRDRSAAAGGQVSYADQIPKLRGLLADEIIAAHGPNGRPYHGYLFLEISKFDDGSLLGWTDDFAICAIPARYGATSRRSFIMSTNATILGLDLGGESRFVATYPVDVLKSPWAASLCDDE